MTEAIAVGFGIEDFIFLLHGAVMARRHGLRKRKNLPGWSKGAVSSKHTLLVIGDSRTRCQFVKLRFVVDSKTNPEDVNGQERVRLETLRLMERPIPVETVVLSNTSTGMAPYGGSRPATLDRAKSGLPSPSKS